MDKVEFISDAEPTMKSLVASVQLMRQHLGYPTVITHSRPGDKGRTAQVEKVIKTLRKQSSTPVRTASDKCGLQLPGDHALWSCALIHAAWTFEQVLQPHYNEDEPLRVGLWEGDILESSAAALQGEPMSSLDLNGYRGFGSPRLMVMICTLWQVPMGFYVEKPFEG